MSQIEMFDVLDAAGRKTGQIAEKREVHRNGLWHTGMHLCITDGRGNVIQQLRGSAPHVRILPDVWDLFAVAGHVSAGEEPIDTLLRETEEEIGVRFPLEVLEVARLREVSVTRSDYWVDDPSFPGGGYHHRVRDRNFVVRLPELHPDMLRLEENKVIAVRQYPVEQLLHDLSKGEDNPDYQQHAHRPVDDDRLYQTVLAEVAALTF